MPSHHSREPSAYFAPSLFARTRSGTMTTTASSSASSSSSRSSGSRMQQDDHPYMPAQHVRRATGMDGLTSDEFNTLPPVFRRKFFSSHERLRFAHATTDTPPHRRPSTQVGRQSIVSISRPRAITGGPERAAIAPPGSAFSPVDAQWFMSLPDKVKSRHFTKEEQAFLRGQGEGVTLDASDDVRYRRPAMRSPSVSPGASPRQSIDHQRQERNAEASKGWIDDKADDPLRFFETDDDLDLRLKFDDYHAYISPDQTVPALPADGRSRKPSFRRAAFYASRISGRSWSLPMQTTRRPSREAGTQERKGSTVSALSGISALPLPPPPSAAAVGVTPQDSTWSVDAGATYYRDPEARLKLRVYLASPQKFDEAIEFGFPSIEQAQANNSAQQHSRRASTKSGGRLSQSGFKSFLEDGDDEDDEDGREQLPFEGGSENDEDSESESTTDEDESELDDHEDQEDETSTPDTDQPMNPVELDTTFRSPHRLPYAAKLHSTDSTTSRPAGGSRVRRFESYAYAPASNREMTLRITLTRPDLQHDPAADAKMEGGGGGGGATIAPGVITTAGTGKWHRRRSSTTPSLWFPREKNDPLGIDNDDLLVHHSNSTSQTRRPSTDAGNPGCIGAGRGGNDSGKGRAIAGLDNYSDGGESCVPRPVRAGDNHGMKKFWKKVRVSTARSGSGSGVARR